MTFFPTSARLALASMALVSCGGAVTVASDEAPRRALDGFFRALDEERYADAYQLLDPSSRAQTSEQRFVEQYVQAAKAGRGLDAYVLTPTAQLTSTRAVFTADLSFENGETRAGDVAVVREGSRWLVVLPPS